MSPSSISLTPPTSPTVALLTPQSSPKPKSRSTTTLNLPPSLPPPPEGFVQRLKKRTPSFPKSLRSTAVNHSPVAHDPQDLPHTELSYPIAACNGIQTLPVQMPESSSPSTQHLLSPSKKTFFGKLAAALSGSVAPMPPSPTLSMDEERASMSTIRPHTVLHGERHDKSWRRRVTSSDDIVHTSLHSSCEDLGLSGEDKLFEYAESMSTSSPISRRSSRSLPLPPSRPPTGPLPPLPAIATSIPIPVYQPRSLPLVPLPDLPGHSREVAAQPKSELEVPDRTVWGREADANVMVIQGQEILSMRQKIADQQKEIDTLRKSANQVERRSVGSQTDDIGHLFVR